MPQPRTDLPALGARLRGARLAMGLTQVGFAAAIGRSQSFVSDYETGETELEAPELRRVLDALAVPREQWGEVLSLAGEPAEAAA